MVVGLDAGDHYTLTINDFMMTGGDGYPNVRTTAATQDILDQDLADYIATLPGNQLTPVIQHRVSCFDPNPGAGAQLPRVLAVGNGPGSSQRNARSRRAFRATWLVVIACRTGRPPGGGHRA